MSDGVKITERGWPGHYICAHQCRFRRNTLVERENTRIVVSTVGNHQFNREICQVGDGRYYETMAFKAKFDEGYWDADVSKRISIPPSIKQEVTEFDITSDAKANDMHDNAVAFIVDRLVKGDEL